MITMGGGTVVATKSLPETWIRPVVSSVVLPAHAQVSPPSGQFVETQASGPLCGGVFAGGDTPNPPPFVFDWTGRTPTGDATLSVVAEGDVNGDGSDESWTITFNGTTLAPTVGNVGGGMFNEPTTATETFTIPLADLIGTSATVTATATSGVDCFVQSGGPNINVNVDNMVTITLAFPETSP